MGAEVQFKSLKGRWEWLSPRSGFVQPAVPAGPRGRLGFLFRLLPRGLLNGVVGRVKRQGKAGFAKRQGQWVRKLINLDVRVIF